MHTMTATSEKVPAFLPAEGTLTHHRRPLHALTGIRFFASAYVVLHHTLLGLKLQQHGYTRAGQFFFNGFLAVPLFFTISGFILSYTYRGQIARSRDRVRFWQARFARLWPGYAFSLLATTVVQGLVPTVGLVVASLFMVQGWNPWHIGYAAAWNTVCWTLTVEAFFYLLFPWIQAACERMRWRGLVAVAVTAIAISLAFNTAPMEIGHAFTYAFFEHVPFPVSHLPEFLLGVALGNMFLQKSASASQVSTHPRTNRGAGTRGMLTYGGIVFSALVLIEPAGRWTSAVVAGFGLLIYGLASERTLVSRFLSLAESVIRCTCCRRRSDTRSIRWSHA
jgi:peptidoglycan/LPS O-acetylase OafA/YrhL